MAGKYNSVGQLRARAVGRLTALGLQKMAAWLNFEPVGPLAWAPAAAGRPATCWRRPG
jgi:hypothetical protein